MCKDFLGLSRLNHFSATYKLRTHSCEHQEDSNLTCKSFYLFLATSSIAITQRVHQASATTQPHTKHRERTASQLRYREIHSRVHQASQIHSKSAQTSQHYSQHQAPRQRASSDSATVQLRTPSTASTQCKNWLAHLITLAWTHEIILDYSSY